MSTLEISNVPAKDWSASGGKCPSQRLVRLWRKNLGQTILEVVVALTLIILFLSGIVIVELGAIKNVEYTRNKSLATRLARQQLERARVVRDSAGINALSICKSPLSCYINADLTPIQPTPTGTYGQMLQLQATTAVDCPLPAITITPIPVSYKTTAVVSWGLGVVTTPAPEVANSSCITDWR